MGHTGALKGVVLTADSDENDAGGWHAGTGMLLPLANVPLIERILDAYERPACGKRLSRPAGTVARSPSSAGTAGDGTWP